MKGYISLHRKIWDNPVLNHNKDFSPREAFIYMLTKANHKDADVVIGVQLHKVKRGSLITSQAKLRKKFKWGNTKLRNFLKLLVNAEMIEVKTQTNLTHISICKYETYQDNQTTNKLLATQVQTGSKSIANTNNNVNNDNNVNNVYKRMDIFSDSVYDEGKRLNIESSVIDDFIDYWSELNKSKSKMKWELQKTFEVKRRLKRWINNSFNKTKKPNLKRKFKYSSTYKHYIGYCGNQSCSSFGVSDFYDIWETDKGLSQTKCCGTEVLPERVAVQIQDVNAKA